MKTLHDIKILATETEDHLPIRLKIGGEVLRGPFHVTELRHLTVRAIDCGGRTSESVEAELEVLPGGQNPLTAGRFAKILTTSVNRVPGLGDAPLTLRHQKGDTLGLFPAEDVRREDDGLWLDAGTIGPVCKPARDTGCCTPKVGTGCCG